MKTCLKCKQIKPFSEYYPHRTQKYGVRCWCKVCEQQYRQSEKGKAAKKRYGQSEKNKCVQKRYNKRYSQTEKGKVSRRKSALRYFIRYPKRRKAKAAVNYAVRIGKIPCIKTRRCYSCFGQAQQYHHYKGYERKFWLDVIPVCRKCHKKYAKIIY